MLPTKFQKSLSSGEERKIDFHDVALAIIGFPLRTNLLFFYLQVILMLPTKFQVNWHFGSREE